MAKLSSQPGNYQNKWQNYHYIFDRFFWEHVNKTGNRYKETMQKFEKDQFILKKLQKRKGIIVYHLNLAISTQS